MPDIFHNFPINVSPSRVFEGISTHEGLDRWWTKSSVAHPAAGSAYTLDFGPGYIWKAVVTIYQPVKHFELQFTDADEDWLQTKVGFTLTEKKEGTGVAFYHTGWRENNEHYRGSSFCWAMYLRILKRWLEFGEVVEYEIRLDV